MKVVIGTRGSDLAVTQTKYVIDLLKSKNPNIDFEIKTIKTKGDILNEVPIDKIGGKEVFIKEIEKELLNKSIDLAIHSMKDVPGEIPKGLKLSYIPEREDHRDVLVLRHGLNSLEDLPKGAKIGTGSKRRKYQILNYRDDLEIISIRGNVQTRIDRIESENLDGIILAAAGINRLGLDRDLKYPIYTLDDDVVLSSPCQGILGIEIREDDNIIDNIVKSISNEKAEIQAKAERAFLKGTGGSCHIPVAAFCSVNGDNILLKGVLGTENGDKLVSSEKKGHKNNAYEIGLALAEKLNRELE